MPYKDKIRANLHRRWSGMNMRCYNPTHPSFNDYGGRGIRVCHQWKNSFSAFELWAHESGFSEDLYLDRIEVNGNYTPGNCRWISASENVRNRRWTESRDRQMKLARARVNETKLKAAVFKAHAKPIQCVETGEVFPSFVHAGRAVGVTGGHISNVSAGVYGPNATAGGFHWKRI